MDRSTLHYYEQELRFLRELGAEFARKFPKVAARLGVSELSNADPHVERLFQGFAFLSSRIQQRLAGEFRGFSETVLEQAYAHPLRPTPSMVMVQFQPTPNEPSLSSGVILPRGTELRARSRLASGVVCQYRTAHEVQLWPIEIESLEYTSVMRSIADLRVPSREPIRALLRIGLKMTGGRGFDELPLSTLPLYVGGADDASARLYEALVAHAGTLVLRWGPRPSEHVAFGDAASATRQLGFDEEHALLPGVPGAFRGFRLLHEYFAFPARFHCVELRGLGTGVSRCRSDRLELIVPLRHYDPSLEGKLAPHRLQLFTTPAVNLFERRCDVQSESRRASELEILPDRTQPLDYEVHSVTRVAANVASHVEPRIYRPQHVLQGRLEPDHQQGCYTLERRPRMVPYDEQRQGGRTGYAGSTVTLTLVEPVSERRTERRQVVVDALCTNRDLPLLLGRDRESFFTLSSGAPVDEVRCLAGPSAPRYEAWSGESVWQLVSHLNQNYLSVNEELAGSAALRELLALYARVGDPVLRHEIEGVRGVTSKPAIGPYPQPGPNTFVRGLEIHLQCEERAFAQGALTLASVLSTFFARQATTHSFTQTVLHTLERGEVYRWPALPGLRPTL